MKKSENFIPKEKVLKGLRMELSFDELVDICQEKLKRDRYYDFESFKAGFYKIKNKEVSFEYFRAWCILVVNCMNILSYSSKKINLLLCEIACFFDGYSFAEEYKEKDFKGDIAVLKNFNHNFINLRDKTKIPFETNGIERVLQFDHMNFSKDSSVYRVLIKDNINKVFDIRYVDDAFFEFDENINFTFVDEAEFENFFYSVYNVDGWVEDHSIKFL